MSAVLKYSLLRFALFGVVFAALWATGAGPVVAVFGGALVSVLLAYVLLRGPREAATRAIEEQTRRRLEQRSVAPPVDQDAAVEDAAVDRASERPGPGTP